MTHDQLQFALTQYLDGTLPVERRAQLEQILAADEAARRMLEEYRNLDAALSQSLPLPQVKWDRLAAHLSAVVSERGEAMRQALARGVDEQTEYAITQYLDGELPPDEHAAIQQRLETDPAARQVADDYQSLDRLLRTELPLPAIRHEALTGLISEAIDESLARSRWQIGWVRGAASLALAACILVGIGFVYQFYMRSPAAPGPSLARVSEIAVLVPDSSAHGKPVIDISVAAPSRTVDNRYSFASAGVVEGEAAQLHVQLADQRPLSPVQDSFLQ
jgi:anti-sigma factor RsiW